MFTEEDISQADSAAVGSGNVAKERQVPTLQAAPLTSADLLLHSVL